MQISFNYNKKQVIQALRYHFVSRKEIRILIIFINVFTIASALLYFTKKISPVAFMLGTTIWLATLVIFWFILPNLIYKKNFTFKDNFVCDLSDSHFLLQNSRGSRTWAWRQFSAWMETPHFFHLYFDARSFFLVPKDAFANANEVLAARNLFMEKIAKK
jgi:hypothetical protein